MPDYEMDEDGVHKEFWVSFYNLPSVVHLRQLRTEKIGTLVAVTGTVTKTSEVRLLVYLCVHVCVPDNSVQWFCGKTSLKDFVPAPLTVQ